MITATFLTPDEPAPRARRKPLQRESTIEHYLVKRVKAMGGEVRKVKWVGRSGAPDRLVMLPDVGRGGRLESGEWVYYNANYPSAIWVELKAPGKAATFPHNAHERAQHREHERMRKMGQRVEVVDSFERVEEILGC